MPPAPHDKVDAEAVTVRMYRGLLGDCFLLTHTLGPAGPGQRVFRALIDCGVLQCMGAKGARPNTQAALDHMEQVVASLAADTERRLDLVVATHEHYDHLSGFLLYHEVFKTFSIGAVWVAWTENQTDGEAKDIRENGKKATSILKAVVERTPFAVDGSRDPRLETIESLLQFYEPELEAWSADDAFAVTKKPPRLYNPAVQAPRSCANAIEWLRFKAGEANVKYLEPGAVVRFGLDDRLKASVLGPPRSDRLLKLNPTGGVQREVYLTKPDEVASLETTLRVQAFAAAPAASQRPSQVAADLPFSPRFNRTEAELEDCPIWKIYEGTPDDAVTQARRIDGEWLGTAELLALKVDGDVNNTSLVLAIETPGPHRDVLLFPGDAQVGNWLSWHDQSYPAKPATPADPIETAADILSRVILYKVGHHGSHNATASEKGLELMTSPNLVAMIPVVKAVAREQTKTGWEMPFDKLFARLKAKTRERIVLGDGDRNAETTAFEGSLFQLTYDDANADPLWVEARLDLGADRTAPANELPSGAVTAKLGG
jgi:hypothetical protein